MDILRIDSKRELFIDYYLIEKLDGTQIKLCTPQEQKLMGAPLRGHYMTIIQDGNLFRAYYRNYIPGYDGKIYDGNPGEITCYAESLDGLTWTYPGLKILKINGSYENNAILAHNSPFSHNFSPFLDTRQSVEPEFRYKALAGIHREGGLYAFASNDGIHWAKMNDQPVITSKEFAFDSQNVVFWSQCENCYVCFFRSWSSPPNPLRTISRTTSQDFLEWTESVPLTPNEKKEHLYTSNTHPYFRAPHIYIALATRLFPDRGNSTDITFMTARGNSRYSRLFKGAFIRPGVGSERWRDRANYVAQNVVPTSETEMSIYHGPGCRRYVLRTDGFSSVNAGFDGGTMVTKPFVFKGEKLEINYSTSAGGYIVVGIQTPNGESIPGYRFIDCNMSTGDEIKHYVSWGSKKNVKELSGTPIRLMFVMADADLYSMQFKN